MVSKGNVLKKALLKASKEMGICKRNLQKIIGINSDALKYEDIDLESKSGELSLMLIRCYQNLYALVGSNKEQMQHWMHTHNKGTQGIPVEQLSSIDGLVHVTEYLDRLCRKR